jgi:hypothetical protein
VNQVSSPGAPGTVTSTGPAGPRPDDRGDPVARIGPEDVMTAPFAGQPGHGSTAFVRNQPARIADGRFQAGSTVVLLQTPAVAESTEVGST